MTADPVTAMLNKEVVARTNDGEKHRGTLSEVFTDSIVLSTPDYNERNSIVLFRTGILSIFEVVPAKDFLVGYFEARARMAQEKQVLQI